MAIPENGEKNRSIGGLWLKTSKAGKKYFSGQIELNGSKTFFAVFKNERKEEGSKEPDYRILESNNQGGGTAPVKTQTAARPQVAPKRVARPAPVDEVLEDETDSDLPF